MHLTRDGHVVLMHDEELNRTTSGTGRVMDMDLAQLARLDAGDGQAVPLLGQLLDLLAGRCRLMCELKADGMEESVAGAVLSRGLQAEVMFISFRFDRLMRLRQCCADFQIGALIAAPTLRDVDAAMDLGVTYIGGTRSLCHGGRSFSGSAVPVWPPAFGRPIPSSRCGR